MAEIKTINYIPLADTTARENITTINENITTINENINQLSDEIANLSGGKYSSIEPKEDDIPKVFIDGTIPTTKTEVLATMTYVSKTEEFTSYITIKCQGDSSMGYPKKNFTVKMYSDETRETKLKKEFKGWGNHNKFVLKANYVDHSHARNIISSKLWGECVATRNDYESLPNGLKESPNNGAIEGFPIKVYNNGTYQGIYTWNIPKDDWLYGIDEDNPNQFVLYGQKNTNGVYAENSNNFRKLWNGVSQAEGEWELEVGTNSDIVKNALNNVISLCMNADDETFKNTLNDYLDIQSALDYYIHCYTICALDSLAQNMILVSYDGAKLYCSYYDGDSTFGLWWNGNEFVSTTYRCPEDYQESYSLLWERIEKLFTNELKARYFELRKTVYSFSNMVNHFERFMDLIGNDLYAEDLTIYSSIPSGSTNNISQLRNYIRDRLSYCDEEFTNMIEPISCTSITLNRSQYTFTDTTPITLTATVNPSNTTDVVKWVSNDTSIAIVTNGVVTPLKNGTCTITATCGNCSSTCSITVNGIVTQFGITNNLTNVTSDNTSTSIGEGESYVANLTPIDGYSFDTVEVTMGGVDVTSNVYSNGVITISSVTENLVITATAIVASSGYAVEIMPIFDMKIEKEETDYMVFTQTLKTNVVMSEMTNNFAPTADAFTTVSTITAGGQITWVTGSLTALYILMSVNKSELESNDLTGWYKYVLANNIKYRKEVNNAFQEVALSNYTIGNTGGVAGNGECVANDLELEDGVVPNIINSHFEQVASTIWQSNSYYKFKYDTTMVGGDIVALQDFVDTYNPILYVFD